MPLATDPEQIYKIILTSDENRDNPPAFTYRYLTARESRRVREFHQQIKAADKDSDLAANADEILFDLLRVKLVGWENMGTDFDPAKLEDILTLAEAFELLFRVVGQRPEVMDIKKSKSLSECNTDDSAESVPVASDAPISPTP